MTTEKQAVKEFDCIPCVAHWIVVMPQWRDTAYYPGAQTHEKETTERRTEGPLQGIKGQNVGSGASGKAS